MQNQADRGSKIRIYDQTLTCSELPGRYMAWETGCCRATDHIDGNLTCLEGDKGEQLKVCSHAGAYILLVRSMGADAANYHMAQLKLNIWLSLRAGCDMETVAKVLLNREGGLVLDPDEIDRATQQDLVNRVADGRVYLTTAPKGWELYDEPEGDDPRPEFDPFRYYRG